MSLFTTINSVARYERKLLFRSWFFRIFAILSLVPICFFNWIFLKESPEWTLRAIPSNIPYMNLLFLNVGQAIIAIFLASDFIKRDKKLDTSEVFFVKPMSNVAYVIGKTWGTLQMFLGLNLVALAIGLVMNSLIDEAWIDWSASVFYFFVISVPTLVFIIGLSYFMMTLLKNQGITFVLLLGYIAFTLFYVKEKCYYLFDYIGYNLPLMKSDVVGFTNLHQILMLRGMYLLLGLGLIGLTIFKLERLPNTRRGKHISLLVTLLLLGSGFSTMYFYISGYNQVEDDRENFLTLNNNYARGAVIRPLHYDISLTQHPDSVSSTLIFKGVALQNTKELIFTLNPGLKLRNLKLDNRQVPYRREAQIICIEPEKEIAAGDTLQLSFDYGGTINRHFCYLDIEAEEFNKTQNVMMFNVDKQYAFVTPRFLMLIPECYWYPRPGTSYSAEHPDWQQSFFADYSLSVKPLAGLTPVSQGSCETDSVTNTWRFNSSVPMIATSLVIGDYEKKSLVVDSVSYERWHFRGHDFITQSLDSIRDTIPALITAAKDMFESSRRLKYPFSRLAAVEVPAQFAHYERLWSMAQECIQPELIFIKERAYNFSPVVLSQQLQQRMKWRKYDRRQRTDLEIKVEVLEIAIRQFTFSTGGFNFNSQMGGKAELTQKNNPYYIFPQLFNFRVNIYSDEWAFANRLLELYIVPNSSEDWIRNYNGISNQEKVNLFLRQNSFRQLLDDPNMLKLRNDLIALKADELFRRGERMVTRNDFQDYLYRFIESHSFRNVSFNTLIDSLSLLTEVPFEEFLPVWMDSVSVPVFEIEQPQTVLVREKSREKYETTVRIRNTSKHKGLLLYKVVAQQNEFKDQYVFVEGEECIDWVVHTETAPNRYEFNTLISANIPSKFNFGSGRVETVTNRLLREESSYPAPYESINENEIIVDDEDPGFSVTEDKRTGLLPRLMTKPKDESTRFSGLNWWRTPVNWIITTNSHYYGKTIRSARAVRKGDGSKYAQWKIEIPQDGQYDLYYFVAKYEELQYSGVEGTYQFYVQNEGDQPEEITLNLRKANPGWQELGILYANKGTLTVKLTNKTNMRSIEADAVKLVKR